MLCGAKTTITIESKDVQYTYVEGEGGGREAFMPRDAITERNDIHTKLLDNNYTSLQKIKNKSSIFLSHRIK